MGWPEAHPEGWAEVERDAVQIWMVEELIAFHSSSYEPHKPNDMVLIAWLQAEHGDIFRALVEATGLRALAGAEADYLEREWDSRKLVE